MSGFLLDTQIVLWMLQEPHRLSGTVRRIITDEPGLFVSAASLWEIETKRQINKLQVEGDVRSPLEAFGLQELPITWRHAQAVGRLPLIHRDPFDRILAAQALADDLTLVTADRDLARYPIRTLF
jgi:PIN domain nuclease of toxin-antitoxin system